MTVPSFEECRRQAYALLGDAADWIRMGDWPPIDTERDTARLEALRLIGEAKDALNRAAGS